MTVKKNNGNLNCVQHVTFYAYQCRLLITCAYSLGLDQTLSGSKQLETLMVFLREFSVKKYFGKKNQQTTKKHKKYPLAIIIEFLCKRILTDITEGKLYLEL